VIFYKFAFTIVDALFEAKEAALVPRRATLFLFVLKKRKLSCPRAQPGKVKYAAASGTTRSGGIRQTRMSESWRRATATQMNINPKVGKVNQDINLNELYFLMKRLALFANFSFSAVFIHSKHESTLYQDILSD
jgi:hypothetical protein